MALIRSKSTFLAIGFCPIGMLSTFSANSLRAGIDMELSSDSLSSTVFNSSILLSGIILGRMPQGNSRMTQRRLPFHLLPAPG